MTIVIDVPELTDPCREYWTAGNMVSAFPITEGRDGNIPGECYEVGPVPTYTPRKREGHMKARRPHESPQRQERRQAHHQKQDRSEVEKGAMKGGSSAFGFATDLESPDGSHSYIIEPGLTKREWFAGMALQGFLASGARFQNYSPGNVAVEAVECADALLAKLEGR